jgi:hypothetical protein
MTVWVLIAVFYGGHGSMVIDNIKDARSCRAAGARIMDVAVSRGQMVAIDCMPVSKVKP